jgi:hypothetical protein
MWNILVSSRLYQKNQPPRNVATSVWNYRESVLKRSRFGWGNVWFPLDVPKCLVSCLRSLRTALVVFAGCAASAHRRFGKLWTSDLVSRSPGEYSTFRGHVPRINIPTSDVGPRWSEKSGDQVARKSCLNFELFVTSQIFRPGYRMKWPNGSNGIHIASPSKSSSPEVSDMFCLDFGPKFAPLNSQSLSKSASLLLLWLHPEWIVFFEKSMVIDIPRLVVPPQTLYLLVYKPHEY